MKKNCSNFLSIDNEQDSIQNSFAEPPFHPLIWRVGIPLFNLIWTRILQSSKAHLYLAGMSLALVLVASYFRIVSNRICKELQKVDF
jgi:hypothetical protein